jgi:large subunit ribosomal protein L25
LVKVAHELEVEADPVNLPHELEVDISVLVAIGDQIHAKDVALPAGVTLITDPEEVIVLIQEVEEERVEEAPADLSAIEVEQKGKEEAAEGGEIPTEEGI